MGKRLTIADIAREAGVSPTAASFYLNGKAKEHHLADVTCERIEAVIKKHDYAPSFNARAVGSGKSHLLGVVVGDINRSFWTDIIAGIEEAIERRQYTMVLTVSHYQAERERDILTFLGRKGVDGLIHAPILLEGGGAANTAALRKLADHIPVVSLTNPREGFPSVYNDNAAGGRLAAAHLHALGHRQVAYIGPADVPLKRGVAFRQFFQEQGVDVPAYASVDAFLPDAKRFTAAFCFSDYVLLDLYGKARAAGISIPQDLSAVGYDNLDFVQFLTPAATTVHQYKAELGVAAGELMLQLLAGASPERQEIKFTPRLVEGESAARVTT